MATSGTVATTVFTTRQVIDHAFRRCRLAPQQITSEHIQTALELLWLSMQMLNSRGILLNAVQPQLLGLNDAVASLLTPAGTLDVLSANLRSLQRIGGTPQSSSGTASYAFDGDLSTSCATGAPLANISLSFTSESALNNVGVLPNASGTWSFLLQVSDDGATWRTVYTEPGAAAVDGTWLWYEISGVSATSFARIVATDTTVLDVTELVFGNTPQDVPLSPINRDIYDWLPNKQQTGRPVQYWLDRQRTLPIMHLYPPPSSAYAVTFLVVLRTQRQLMDVGTLQQELELPNRWYLPIVADLARHLAAEIKDVDAGLTGELDAKADALISQAWDSESDGSDAQLLPNLSVYRA